jgi:hypothetical protein
VAAACHRQGAEAPRFLKHNFKYNGHNDHNAGGAFFVIPAQAGIQFFHRRGAEDAEITALIVSVLLCLSLLFFTGSPRSTFAKASVDRSQGCLGERGDAKGGGVIFWRTRRAERRDQPPRRGSRGRAA